MRPGDAWRDWLPVKWIRVQARANRANSDCSVPQLVIHSVFLPIVAWAGKTVCRHRFLRDGPDTYSHRCAQTRALGTSLA
jgi:hypothetical protein